MAWVLSNPNVNTAITGASRPSQLHDTLGALSLLEDGTISGVEEQLENIFQID